MASPFPVLTAAEAASLLRHGDVVGFSGFTAAGSAKAVSRAIAARAREEHTAGRPFKIGMVTGASTGPSLDGELAKADAISFRTPFQSDPDMRKAINAGSVQFFDMHLSVMPQNLRYGFLGKMNWAVIEACDVSYDGRITLTSSVGASPTQCRMAEKIIIELSGAHPQALHGIHDIYEPADPPLRREIPIYHTYDRIGSPTIQVPPHKIAAIVHSNIEDEISGFDEASPTTVKIGENVANFLAAELRRGTLPSTFLPLQSGVGDVANAVLGAMGTNPDIPPFEMYSEVLQDSVFNLMKTGKIRFASSVALTASPAMRKEIYSNLDFFKSRVVLRPQEITNHPEVIRRLGIVSINTAIEADIFGNINSTHVLGRDMMNGIGGSGDFTRNAFLSIFTCPSTAKNGKISTIVPLVSHMDHSEHSVGAIVTEWGVADLRGKSPHERAMEIINKCAHPDFRELLLRYCDATKKGHTPQSLSKAFAFHQQFLATGDMHGAAVD
ncbi:succinate CoA transferase [Nibricoccus sp. IMCC34717]|uniref:succinate CoA transferase n=1 Tax=Nibricoccus sp. IMCC34717 TaxID=3034021 RepID=UPI0038516BF6